MSANGHPLVHSAEVVSLELLRPHPRNYREHRDDQRAHLVESIREHGVYRNVIVARDLTILAGHGVVEAARESELTEIPVVRLDLDADDPRALKILTGDNEIARLAASDDGRLAELLAEIRSVGELLGTGYDDGSLETLQRLVESAGGATDALNEWAGMPEFVQDDRQSVFHTTVHFASEQDAERFFALVGATRRSSFWWPVTDGLIGSNVAEQWVGQ